MLFSVTLDTIDFPYLHLWVQPTKDSTNQESKIFIKKKKNSIKFQKAKLGFAMLTTIYIIFILY